MSNETSSPRIADRLARTLSEAGVRHAFGVPGGEVLTVIDALERAGVAFHAARQESAAGFLAEGASVGREVPGVMVATIGPGVANAVNVAANARQEAFPLVILGGRVAADEDAAFTHQVFDQAAVFRPVTKAVITLDAQRSSEQIGEIVALAMSEPRGPVYVDCPVDVMDTVAPTPALAPVLTLTDLTLTDPISTDLTWTDPMATDPMATDPMATDPISTDPISTDPISTDPMATDPMATEASADPSEGAARRDLREALAQAERPLLLLGRNALRPGVAAALAKATDRQSWSVLTTYRAKGLFDEGRPESLGAVGLSPRADAMVLPFVARADVVLLVGYDPIEMRRNWTRPFTAEQSIFALGPGGTEPGFAADDRLAGADILSVLDELALGDEKRIDQSDRAALRAGLTDAFATDGSWSPGVLFEALTPHLGDPRRTPRVTVDTGAHRILFAQQWRSRDPDGLMQSSGLCTMACALPLAIGAALADPDRGALAIVGDGGLEMGLGELATARDLEVPVTVLVIDDASYALIEMKQRARGLPNAGVDLGRTDFATIAKGFGLPAWRVESLSDFEHAMRESGRQPGPSLIHAVFARGAYDDRI